MLRLKKKQPYALAWHFSNITLTLTPILLYSRDRSVRYHWIMKRILPFYGNSCNYSVCRHMRLLSCLDRPSITEEPNKTEIDLRLVFLIVSPRTILRTQKKTNLPVL